MNDLVFFLIGLAVSKGVVEPIASYWGKRAAQKIAEKSKKYLPLLFPRLDPYIPQAIQELTPNGLYLFVRDSLLVLEIEIGDFLTKDEEAAVITDFFSAYDPSQNANVTPVPKDLTLYKGQI